MRNATNILACKFGGTSVKDDLRILHVRNKIIRRDRRRRAIVVSAPAGVTNQLIEWVERFTRPVEPSKDYILDGIRDRFIEMVRGLGLSLDINAMFREIRAHCEDLRTRGKNHALYNYAVSRGEWANGQIVAAALDFEFVDALRFIVVDHKGH